MNTHSNGSAHTTRVDGPLTRSVNTRVIFDGLVTGPCSRVVRTGAPKRDPSVPTLTDPRTRRRVLTRQVRERERELLADRHELLNGESISNVAVDHALDRLDELYRHLMSNVAEQIRHLPSNRQTRTAHRLANLLLSITQNISHTQQQKRNVGKASPAVLGPRSPTQTAKHFTHAHRTTSSSS